MGTLPRFMTTRSERFTAPALAGVSLRALHRGDPSRPALVLLHGGGANAHWWDHLAPSLAEHWYVVALDFRGHGDSDYPEEIVQGAFVRDLEGLLEHLGTPHAVLVGHSMGGHIALEHAAAAPGVRALIAIDVARGASRTARRMMRLALALRPSYGSRDEAIARYQFIPPARRASETLRSSIARHSVRREADGRFSFKFDPRWFAQPPGAEIAFERISCPTLLVRGGESRLLTPDRAVELRERIPNARLVEIPEAGHHVHLDQPETVLETIQQFLATV